MNFWRELWKEIRHPWKEPEYQYIPLPNADPDWEERQRLQKEKRRLQKKLELMQLTEDIDNLRDNCEKMTLRHQEFEQRHQNPPTQESR